MKPYLRAWRVVCPRHVHVEFAVIEATDLQSAVNDWNARFRYPERVPICAATTATEEHVTTGRPVIVSTCGERQKAWIEVAPSIPDEEVGKSYTREEALRDVDRAARQCFPDRADAIAQLLNTREEPAHVYTCCGVTYTLRARETLLDESGAHYPHSSAQINCAQCGGIWVTQIVVMPKKPR